MVRQNYPYYAFLKDENKQKPHLESEEVKEMIETAEQFVADWGSGQSTDTEMLQELLGLMGLEEIHPNCWVKI